MLGRKRLREVGREEVVAAAASILATEGPRAVTARALARVLDVPEQQVDVGLHGVLGDAYRVLSTREAAQVKRKILANPSPVEQMRALLAVLATPPESDSDAFRLEAWILSRTDPALRAAVQESAAAWHGLVASVIRRGARSGEFPQADADQVATHVISLIEGINSYQLIGSGADYDRMQLLTRVLKAELGMAWGPQLTDALA